MSQMVDPTFYRSPAEAIAAPPERLAYVAGFDPAGKANDAIAVLDCDTASPDYGTVVGVGAWMAKLPPTLRCSPGRRISPSRSGVPFPEHEPGGDIQRYQSDKKPDGDRLAAGNDDDHSRDDQQDGERGQVSSHLHAPICFLRHKRPLLGPFLYFGARVF